MLTKTYSQYTLTKTRKQKHALKKTPTKRRPKKTPTKRRPQNTSTKTRYTNAPTKTRPHKFPHKNTPTKTYRAHAKTHTYTNISCFPFPRQPPKFSFPFCPSISFLTRTTSSIFFAATFGVLNIVHFQNDSIPHVKKLNNRRQHAEEKV